MSTDITRRRFVKITTAAAGLTIGSAFIAGCSSGTASSTSEATTGAVSTATYDTGRAPKFMGAMNKAQKIDTTPDEDGSTDLAPIFDIARVFGQSII